MKKNTSKKNTAKKRDPFSDENMNATLNAYRMLKYWMELDDRTDFVRVFNDAKFAAKMFDEYKIPNNPYRM